MTLCLYWTQVLCFCYSVWLQGMQMALWASEGVEEVNKMFQKVVHVQLHPSSILTANLHFNTFPGGQLQFRVQCQAGHGQRLLCVGIDDVWGWLQLV